MKNLDEIYLEKLTVYPGSTPIDIDNLKRPFIFYKIYKSSGPCWTMIIKESRNDIDFYIDLPKWIDFIWK